MIAERRLRALLRSAGAEAGYDVVGVAASLAVGAWVWLGHGVGATADWIPGDGPWWARPGDYLLSGPDAGAWASNATALSLGRTGDLDPHRLPIYPMLTALVMHVQPDVALAGHLVNHLCLLALGPVVYLLGTRWMQRGLAFGAAVVASTWIVGFAAAQRYGVDPLVMLAVPMALLAAEVGARQPWLAPVGGLVAGVAGASHLTTVGLPFAALLLCLLRGEKGKRWPGALAFLVGAVAGIGLVFLNYPLLPSEMVASTLAEGVAPVANNAGRAGTLASPAVAATAVVGGLPAALDEVMRFVATNTRPTWLPWVVALVVPWLGLFGPALVGRWTWRRVRIGLAEGLSVGVPIVAALAPLLAFAAARSPERYTANFFAVVVLVVFRGYGLVYALATVRLDGRWRQVGAVALGLAVAGGLWRPDLLALEVQKAPSSDDIAVRQLGSLIRGHFASGGGASCTLREADAYAGRAFCPYSQGAAFAASPEPIRAQLTAECGGDGDIPYVVLDGSGVHDGSDAARHAMDAWVVDHGNLVATLPLPGFTARLYGVRRSQPTP